MNSNKYIDLFRPTCAFHEGDTICGKPAVGVYISADHLQKGRYVCVEHGHKADNGGDGPMFWMNDYDIQ